MLPSCLRSCRYNLGHFTLFIELMYSIAAGAGASQVIVPKKVNAVLGKNVTLNCRVEVATNLTLTQSSWERQLPSGSVTVAVYNPMFGISIPPEYAHRLSFCSPSSHDAAIVLEDVGFADNGMYTCKVATFPLGNTQASTVVSVLVEPKVYVSAGTVALIDGGNETTVATCIAERARPPAEVSWESNVFGQSVVQIFDEANSTTSTQVRYLWQPTRHVQAHPLTCVVRHPALANDFRIPYELNVQFAPDISVVGYDGDWYLGRENVQLTCRATASPPANHFRWIRLDGDMPWGVETVNNTLLFLRPLQRNDSGVYRCEVANDINLRSRDLRILIQDQSQVQRSNSIAVAGAVMGAALALFLIAVFTIVILTARKAYPPAHPDKVETLRVSQDLFAAALLWRDIAKCGLICTPHTRPLFCTQRDLLLSLLLSMQHMLLLCHRIVRLSADMKGLIGHIARPRSQDIQVPFTSIYPIRSGCVIRMGQTVSPSIIGSTMCDKYLLTVSFASLLPRLLCFPD